VTESIDTNPMPGLNYSASIKSLISKKIKQIKQEKIIHAEKRVFQKQQESRRRVMLRMQRDY
jgi:hypothetical protein